MQTVLSHTNDTVYNDTVYNAAVQSEPARGKESTDLLRWAVSSVCTISSCVLLTVKKVVPGARPVTYLLEERSWFVLLLFLSLN